jgi:uncharacterized protein (DUF2062 family)
MTLTHTKLGRTIGQRLQSTRQNSVLWVQQGLSPRRLALTLSLGVAIGCIPMVGIPTLVCAVLALALGLNQPAIQAANYAVMPLQLILIVPFMRLGARIVASSHNRVTQAGMLGHASPMALLSGPARGHFLSNAGSLAGQALLAWAILAVPAVILLTFTLTLLLRRIPALAEAEAIRQANAA